MRKLYAGVIVLLLVVAACIWVTPKQVVVAEYSLTTAIKWNPVCRHNALYWTSVLGEEYETRIAYGLWGGGPHVQPQIKLNGTWYYFKVKDDKVIFITMDPVYWELKYHMTFIQFATVQNKWMVIERRITK